MESLYLEIGQRIRRERKKRHITQGELAARVGLSDAGHLSAIELGKQRVQVHTLARLARELGVDVCCFFPPCG